MEAVGVDLEGRGRTSIRVLGLDRQQSGEQRADLLKHLMFLARGVEVILHCPLNGASQAQLNKLARLITEDTAARKAFAGFRRYYFRSRGLDEFVADD